MTTPPLLLALAFVLAACSPPQAPQRATERPDQAPAPTVAAPVALGGRVLGADGRPLAGAVVAATGSIDWLGFGPLAKTTTTRADGGFTFDSLPSGAYRVVATAGAEASDVTLLELPTSRSIDVRLGAADRILRGTVSDAAGGAQIGAWVEAFHLPTEATFVARVNADGRFELPVRGGPPLGLVASKEGGARTYLHPDAHLSSFELVLRSDVVPRPPDEALKSWLGASAQPLKTHRPGSGLEDLAPLAKMIGSSRIVALGEATHGSSEIFQLKHRAAELLVDQLGFDVVALEVGFAEALAADEYVRTGKGDPERVVRGLVTDPFMVVEMVELLVSLRASSKKRARPVRVVGFDITSFGSVPMLLDALESAGVTDEALAGDLAPITPVSADGTYGGLTAEEQSKVRAAIARAIVLLEGQRAAIEKKLGKVAWATARRHAHIIEQAELIYRDRTARDARMAENVDWIAREHRGARIALWLHNAHAAAEPWFFDDLGRRLRATYGKDYFALATAFGRGGTRALKAGDVAKGPLEHQTPEPGASSFEAALGLSEHPLFVLDLHDAPTPVRAWLESPLLTWSIGFMYDEEFARVHLAPARAFDALLFARRVTAARELPRKKK